VWWRRVAEPAWHGPRLPRNSHEESVMETYDPKKSRTEVRQGSPRKMNLRVLISSLCGIIILFAVIYLVYTLTQSNPN
jgi:hypothetical protein